MVPRGEFATNIKCQAFQIMQWEPFHRSNVKLGAVEIGAVEIECFAEKRQGRFGVVFS